MTRRVALYLVGSLVLVSMAGCGRGFFQTAEREPWRAEAEIACLKSGEVRENVNVVRISPISGPGVCGADFPLKVAALGDNDALGFADDLRPPAAIPGGGSQPRWPINGRPTAPQSPPSSYPPQRYPQQTYAPPQSYPPVSSAPIAPPASYPARQYGQYGNGGGSVVGAPLSLEPPGPATADDPRYAEPDARYGNPPELRQQQPLPRLGPPQGTVGSIGPVAVKPAATLACPIVAQLDHWISESVQPAAQRWFGSPVVEIKQISAYSCRGMNGNPHAHISEHAFGNALDIAAFTLADGRRIAVKTGWRGLPEEQGFLRDVQGAACQQFTTVLAPGSNAYHYDHIHVDLMRRASRRVICEPAAVSGEQIAARAGGGRSAYAAGDGGYTGSIAQKFRHLLKRGSADDEDVPAE